MGVFDLYCRTCGLPFTPFYNEKWTDKTKWLDHAAVKYKNHIVYLNSYDSYGRFEIEKIPNALKEDKEFQANKENGKLDVEFANNKIWHQACVRRADKEKLVNVGKYQLQEFDQESFLKNKKLLWMLEMPSQKPRHNNTIKAPSPPKPELACTTLKKIITKDPVVKNCMIQNPDSGYFVNICGPTGRKVINKYAPQIIIKD